MSPSAAVVGCAARDPEAEPGKPERGCVGEHVGGVDQQRKAVGHKRSDNLREQAA